MGERTVWEAFKKSKYIGQIWDEDAELAKDMDDIFFSGFVKEISLASGHASALPILAKLQK